MDLTQYKKAWENQPEEKNRVSAIEIYKMTQAKSTSIVKWIFIIGIAEFIFWFAINYLATKTGAFEPYEILDLMTFLNYSTYLHYVVILLFLVLFYRNYSSISAIDDTKTLMKKILRTRKTVKWYVYYNLIMVVILTILLNILIFNKPDAFETLYGVNATSLDQGQMVAVVIITQIIMLGLMLLILWLFYYLLYGILLRKLNRNYKELTKLEEVK